MAFDYSKFDKMVDVEGLKADVADAAAKGGTGSYDEVPVGTYEVEINKMELNESRNGDPMVTIWFKILNGEYKNQMIFMNQVITKGFQIHIVNELLRSMDTGVTVEFENYRQYAYMLMDIAEACDGKLEFALEYGKTKKDFPTFKITEVFEVE